MRVRCSLLLLLLEAHAADHLPGSSLIRPYRRLLAKLFQQIIGVHARRRRHDGIRSRLRAAVVPKLPPLLVLEATRLGVDAPRVHLQRKGAEQRKNTT